MSTCSTSKYQIKVYYENTRTTFIDVVIVSVLLTVNRFLPEAVVQRCSVKTCNFIKKEILAQVFSSEFFNIFKNTFLAAVSVLPTGTNWTLRPLSMPLLTCFKPHSPWYGPALTCSANFMLWRTFTSNRLKCVFTCWFRFYTFTQ